jgi:hypothetical protein
MSLFRNKVLQKLHGPMPDIIKAHTQRDDEGDPFRMGTVERIRRKVDSFKVEPKEPHHKFFSKSAFRKYNHAPSPTQIDLGPYERTEILIRPKEK